MFGLVNGLHTLYRRNQKTPATLLDRTRHNTEKLSKALLGIDAVLTSSGMILAAFTIPLYLNEEIGFPPNLIYIIASSAISNYLDFRAFCAANQEPTNTEQETATSDDEDQPGYQTATP